MKNSRKFLAVLLSFVLLCTVVPFFEVLAAVPSIPEISTEHTVVDSYAGQINSVTVPAGKDMYYDGYRMAGWLPYYFENLSAAEYIEMDIYVSTATAEGAFCFWVTNSWDSATTRGRVSFPALKAGWNHVVFVANKITGNGGFVFSTYDKWNSIFFEGKPNPTSDVTIAFGNIALTKTVSTMNNVHINTVWEQPGLFWDWEQPASTSCNWSDYSYISNEQVAVDASDATYFEFDVVSSVDLTGTGTYVWLSVNTGDLQGRAKYMLPDIKQGFNHIVINLNEYISLSNSGSNVWDQSKFLCMRIKVNSNLPKVDYNLKFYNAACTSDEILMNKTYPASVYEQEGLFWDWTLAANSSTTWNDYTAVDLNGYKIDITGAEYFEFDVVSNMDFPACSVWLSVSSADNGGRVKYDFPSLEKGMNHIVINLSNVRDTSNHGGYTWSTEDFAYMRLSMKSPQLISANLKFYNAAFTWDPIVMQSEKIEEYDPINVTVNGDDNNIINIYAEGMDFAIYSFRVSTYGSGKSFNLLDLGPFTIGDYMINTVDVTSNEVIDSHNFKVVTRRNLRLPTSATYTLKNETDGLAAGTITINIDEELNSATEMVPYWADENGKLSGYESLYPIKITGATTEYDVDPFLIIPKGATRMLLYAQNHNKGTITTDYYEITLPDGAASDEEWGVLVDEIQVVSDTHVSESGSSNSYYTKMLNEIVNLSPNSSGLFIAGDVTTGGTDAQFKKHQELHSSVVGAPDYYIAIGNHEFYDGGQAAQEALEERFVSYARLPDGTSPQSQHYDFWLNGYHYVILGNDGITSDLLSATFTNDTLTWLRNTLEEDRNANRPTFVFLHQPISGTVAGSLGEFTNGAFSGVWGDNATRLKAVLKDFPEVVMFTGHQHITLGYPNTMYEKTDDLPTIFNTSTASQVATITDGIKKKGSGSEGYYVYIYEDKLIVRGRDFESGKWIPSAQFYVDFAGGTGAAKTEVTFDLSDANGNAQTVSVPKGSKISVPEIILEDYIIDDWYKDELLTEKFDFNSYVNNNITIYSKWILKGDVFLDDSLNMLDLVKLNKLLLQLGGEFNKAADIVTDDRLDSLDYIALRKKLFNSF